MSPHWVWEYTFESAPPESRADKAISTVVESRPDNWRFEDDSAEASPIPKLTRSQIQRLIEEGAIRVNSQRISNKDRIRSGDQVRIEIPPPIPLEAMPENIPVEVLYEDSQILVLNKPPGLTVHPSETQKTGTLVNALLHHVQDLSGIGGKLRPGIVHRLDKDTSGALVISKSDEAHLKLAEVFSKHDIERRYWALCYGIPDLGAKKELVIESLIGRNPADRKKMSMDVSRGRNAISHLKLLETFQISGKKPFASLVEVRLETGRTHQVRVHLTGIGNSILGDPVYGVPSKNHTKFQALPVEIRKLVEALPGQALHARVLGFRHPITGKEIRVEAAPPAAFHLLHQALKRYA